MASEKSTENNNERGFQTKSRPANALFAGIKFLMNMEETHHFFRVFDTIDGRQTEKNYQRFLQSEVGARLNNEKVNFADILSDKKYLQSFASGTLADEYLDFLSRESLEIELLLAAERDAQASTTNVDRSRRDFISTGFAIHDLLHVLLGYGREAIGEACLLSFTAEQMNLRGVGLVAHALCLREQALNPRKPVIAMVKEARQRARDAVWVPEVDWREYFAMPLELVRERLNILPPEIYQQDNTPKESIHQDDSADRPSICDAA